MTDEKQVNLDNWDNIKRGNWFKVEHIRDNFPAEAVCVHIEGKMRTFDGYESPRIVLKLDYNKATYDFELNLGNEKKVREACPDSPKQIVGKKLTFGKVRVQNPKTKETVDGLEILKVE